MSAAVPDAAAGAACGKTIALKREAAPCGAASSLFCDRIRGADRASGQPEHLGLRAVQCSRPNKTSRWQKSEDSAGEISLRSAFSTLTGSFSFLTKPSRLDKRIQCVSATIAGLPKISPRIRLAVLRPTPGRRSKSSMLSGTLPSYSLSNMMAQAFRSRALVRNRPQVLIASAISSSGASEKLCRVGNCRNRVSVTILTRASVHWADRRVANSSS